jgi:hypothetical protein
VHEDDPLNHDLLFVPIDDVPRCRIFVHMTERLDSGTSTVSEGLEFPKKVRRRRVEDPELGFLGASEAEKGRIIFIYQLIIAS